MQILAAYLDGDFAPFKKEAHYSFVNDYGIQEFEKQAQKLAKKYGERFCAARTAN